MIRIALLAALALAGCSSSTAIRSPDGATAHLVECHGTELSLGTCYRRAAKICPVGYDVLDVQQGSNGWAPERYVLVRCG